MAASVISVSLTLKTKLQHKPTAKIENNVRLQDKIKQSTKIFIQKGNFGILLSSEFTNSEKFPKFV